ncbi:MAG: gluconate 2-dehydrogenase subunit 3 family protein [Verrucomicrobiota bacterium]
MNSNSQPGRIEVGALDEALLSRREAIKRTVLLLGAVLSPAWLDGIAHAQAQVAVAGGATKPKNLSAAQFATVSAMAERILPKSDTPGAKDVGVPAFIDIMAGDYMTVVERTAFNEGLVMVDGRSRKENGKIFAELSAAQQDALLKALATSASDKEKTFFKQVRDLTVTGYFTSEQVGRHVTHFEPIPGRFEPCVPLSEVGNKSWTR